MNNLRLNEPGFENRRGFLKKARESQKLLRFQRLTFNVSKIEQSFQVSSEFKLNEGIALSFKFALLF